MDMPTVSTTLIVDELLGEHAIQTITTVVKHHHKEDFPKCTHCGSYMIVTDKMYRHTRCFKCGREPGVVLEVWSDEKEAAMREKEVLEQYKKYKKEQPLFSEESTRANEKRCECGRVFLSKPGNRGLCPACRREKNAESANSKLKGVTRRKIIHDAAKKAMNDAGMTQAKLAERMGISKIRVNSFFSKTLIQEHEATAMADILRVPVDQIVHTEHLPYRQSVRRMVRDRLKEALS